MTLEEKAAFVEKHRFKGLAFRVHKATGLSVKTCKKYELNPAANTPKAFEFLETAYNIIIRVKFNGNSERVL